MSLSKRAGGRWKPAGKMREWTYERFLESQE